MVDLRVLLTELVDIDRFIVFNPAPIFVARTIDHHRAIDLADSLARTVGCEVLSSPS